MLRRPQYISLALLVVLALVLLNLPGGTTARLKLTLGSLFLPLFGLTSSAQQAAARAGDALLPRSELLRQNEALLRDNQSLRFQLLKAEETARENERLRKNIGWQQQKPWKVKLGRVVLREPSNWWRTVQIDLGTRDGVSNNLPVLTVDGLVGRVASASLTHSQVVLLGDLDCRVSGMVENETHDTGVIGAAGPLDNSLVEMGYLSRSAHLKPGQKVVTSGLGGLYPKGIPIGLIVDSRMVEYGLSIVARVRLSANIAGLEEVWVLFP